MVVLETRLVLPLFLMAMGALGICEKSYWRIGGKCAKMHIILKTPKDPPC